MKSLNFASLALLPAVLLTITSSCATDDRPKGDLTTTTSYQKGVPGGVVVQTYKTTATVTAIDTSTRMVTIVAPDGSRKTLKAGPDVVNFSQMQVGDQIKVTVAKELVVSMGKEGVPPSDGAASVVALAPEGNKPGGLTADTVQITTKIAAIDLKRHEATLLLPDGTTATFAVRQDVDLMQRKDGEQVVIRTTQALAIFVEKP